MNCLLTKRELEIVCLVCLANKVIGARLGMAQVTVATHLRKIAEKMGGENRTSILVKALRQGMIKLEEIVV